MEEILKELRPLVVEIENSLPTCKNHYDRYMAILSKFPGKETLIAAILIKAGANESGVTAALKIIK